MNHEHDHTTTARTLMIILALALAGCTGVTRSGQPKPTASSSDKLLPLDRALTPLVVRGSLEGQRGDRWRKLEVGRAVRGLSALRSKGRGAMIRIEGNRDGGEEGGRLWLRGGSRLRLGLDSGGQLRLVLERGEARISLFDPTLRARLAAQRGRLIEITAQDFLARTVASSAARTAVAPTATAVQAADWTLLMTIEGGPAAAGLGTLSTRSSSVAHLELRRVLVDAKTAGDVAETRVEHVFYNSSDERLEGTFRFPLPERASLIGLAMEIDGRLMEGELVERQKARRTYESIVEQMQDPALLEWEQGNTFKLRVFPIEPRSNKRIVLRYVSPLHRDPAGLSYRYSTSAAQMQRRIPRFSLKLNGQLVADEKNFAPGRDLVVSAPGLDPALALREVRKDGTYTALRVTPAWSRLSLERNGHVGGPRDLLLIVDTSRSALESRKLALQTMRQLLGDLRDSRDRFLVVAADLTVRDHAKRLVPATAVAKKQALAFIESIEPDGATDLGLALSHAGKRVRALTTKGQHRRKMQVVYLGDGTPTWGETDATALSHLARESLGEVPFHAVILGKGASAELLRRLAAQQGGRAVKPHNLLQVKRMALLLTGSAAVPRLRDVRIRAGERDQIFPRQAPTLFMGDEMVVLMRTPPGEKPPRTVTLEGTAYGQPFVQSIAASRVAPARHVAHRWARMRLSQMEADKTDKEQIVKHSLSYGLMSRHTAFLVLESEEAYKRHQIARRNKQKGQGKAAPQVTGGDLESLGRARASLSPDHFQPGDPEVRIPAPADAHSVVVVFPFGETKVARYEPELKAWTVRFLVAQDTPDGTYQITVRITHKEGRVEILKLSYVVDTKAPTVRVAIRKHRRKPGAYLIHASQIVTRVELVQEARRHQIAGADVTLSDTGRLRRYAQVVKDAIRVEVQAPSGRVLRLWPFKLGEFAATWRPARPLSGEVTLKVVAVDKAYNRKVLDVVFDPATGKVTRKVSR